MPGDVCAISENLSPGCMTAYAYDLAGNILTITLPSGRVITYTRNSNGQVFIDIPRRTGIPGTRT